MPSVRLALPLLLCVTLVGCSRQPGDPGIDVEAMLGASPPGRLVLRYEEAAGMGPEAYHAVVVFADGRVIMSNGPAWLLGNDGSIQDGVGSAGELRRWHLDRPDLVELVHDVLATGITELPSRLEDRQPIMDGAGLVVMITTGADTDHQVRAGNERPAALRETVERIARLTGWEPVDFTVTLGR